VGALLAKTSRLKLQVMILVCGRRITLVVTILLVAITDMIRVPLTTLLFVLMMVMMFTMIMMMGLKIMVVVMLVFGLRSKLGWVVVVKILFNIRRGWSVILLTFRSTRPISKLLANRNHVSNYRLVFPLYKVLDQCGG